MASIGALIDYLTRERAANELEYEDVGGLDIRGIEILALWVRIFLQFESDLKALPILQRSCNADKRGRPIVRYLSCWSHPLMPITFVSSSLQIFEDEKHASVHSDKTKEGLSLFGLF